MVLYYHIMQQWSYHDIMSDIDIVQWLYCCDLNSDPLQYFPTIHILLAPTHFQGEDMKNSRWISWRVPSQIDGMTLLGISAKLGEVMSRRKGRHEETLENCRQFDNSHNRECTFQKISMYMKVDNNWWFSGGVSWNGFRVLSKLGKTHVYIYIGFYGYTSGLLSDIRKFNQLFTIAGDGWQHANEDWSWRLMKVALPKSNSKKVIGTTVQKQMPWFHDNIRKWILLPISATFS